jgi:DNA-binding transcriptional LysR family regulator
MDVLPANFCRDGRILQFVSDTLNYSNIGIDPIRRSAMRPDMTRDRLPSLGSRQLKAVLAVAEYRSFVAAASFLRLSQPALTRTIKQVEGELGVQLFSRNTRHVTVTAAGKEFANLAERLLGDLQIGVAHMRELADRPCGQIVVTSVVSLASAMLPALLADYRRRFSGIEVHLREGLHHAVMEELRSGLADFGIGYIDDAPKSFITENLGTETFHVVLPRDSALARRKTVELRAMADAALVSFPAESRTRRIVDGAAAAMGISFQYSMTANRLPALHGLIRNRIGLAIVPSSERPLPDDPDLVSRPLAGKRLACQIGIMRLRERDLTPAAAEFLNVVRKWLRQFRGRAGRKRLAHRDHLARRQHHSSGSVVNSSG